MSAKHKPAPVEVLLPGFIEATANIQFGAPCLVRTRIGFYVGLGWVWESLDDPTSEGLTREEIIALAAFHAGYKWHQGRKRRAMWEQAVNEWWKEYNRREYGEKARP